jgi:hypothetical protein
VQAHHWQQRNAGARAAEVGLVVVPEEDDVDGACSLTRRSA